MTVTLVRLFRRARLVFSVLEFQMLKYISSGGLIVSQEKLASNKFVTDCLDTVASSKIREKKSGHF